ncbi:MAG: fimbrillin family protein [Prevotella sp.]|nr:fimbrillin family protein [Prevotella sp.]
MRKVSTYKMAFTLLAATSLLAGCSGDDSFNGNGNSNAIAFNTNVNGFFSKASTYNSNDDLKTEGSFTCAAYNATTTTPYIDATTVVWNDTENDGANKWQFANGIKHGWPGASALDFFAYMPATKPDYITSISYPSARSAQFVCTLPPDQSSTKEFVCALATDKTKANSSTGVSMEFKHHFARLRFAMSDASGDNVTINSVTISGIKTTGTCTFDGTTSTWEPSGDNSSLTATAINGTTPYLVIPNTYAAEAITITVNATWTGISSTTVNKTATNNKTITWEPGYSYLFTLKLSGDILIVDTEKFTEQW